MLETVDASVRNEVQKTQAAIADALCYFEVFCHPLTAEEIEQFLPEKAENRSKIIEILFEMAQKGQVWHLGDGHFSTQNRPDWLKKRRENERRAAKFWPIARRVGRLIGQFPFVRGAFVSGSLSKNSMPDGGDIDFFIVTEPGRLWTARTMLVAFKKIFLLGSHRFFCVNYFVDSEHLEIEEKNRFTATETLTVAPVFGSDFFEKFVAANGWARDFLPNAKPREMTEKGSVQPFFGKKWLEKGLSGSFGNWLERRFFRLTLGVWRRKFGHLAPEDFAVSMKSKKGVSKHHPLGFQQRVLARHAENLGHFWAKKPTENEIIG